jgi:23S rRNA pseudouridine2605 synthase
VRLQKYLAECGVASRRAAEKLIEAGRVTLNGAPATLGSTFTPGDSVAVDQQPIAQDDKVYLVLNKPAGTVTTASDTHGRKTVLHLVRDVPARVFPVGRLDMDVSGVLLLTNDGELNNRLIHPRYQVDKVYEAWVYGAMGGQAAERLARGVMLEDGKTAPAAVEMLDTGHNSSHIRLTIHEGRKREVKRMCAAVGHPVRRLQRIAFAGITAEGLSLGKWRYLTSEEVQGLKRITGIAALNPSSPV